MKILLPSRNKQLTDEEFAEACRLIDYYTSEGKQIRNYCRSRGRNADVYDRGNVWEGGFLDGLMKMVLSKKYNNINRLRLIGWHFSAYRLFDLASVVELPANQYMADFYSKGVEEFPDDVDSIILNAVDPEQKINLLMPRLQALRSSISDRYLVSQPGRLGEVAGSLDDYWVNGDSIRYWGAIGFFERSGILKFLESKIAERGFCRVMEIGPGYGGLAYHLKKIYGDKIQFIGVDLVESLVFSSIYLSMVAPSKSLYYKDETSIDDSYKSIFVPSFRSPEFFDALGGGVDLAINTVSMNEMSEAQVDYYGRQISRSLGEGGVFFEVNWKAIIAGPDRIDCKSFLALHFSQRTSIEKTEVAGDGNLDLWSNDLSDTIAKESRRSYPFDLRYYDATGSIPL